MYEKHAFSWLSMAWKNPFAASSLLIWAPDLHLLTSSMAGSSCSTLFPERKRLLLMEGMYYSQQRPRWFRTPTQVLLWKIFSLSTKCRRRSLPRGEPLWMFLSTSPSLGCPSPSFLLLPCNRFTNSMRLSTSWISPTSLSDRVENSILC